MRGLLNKTSKRAWRTALACALASCGLARADEPVPSTAPATTPPPATSPTDLTSLYRDAYTNPGCAVPPGGYLAAPPQRAKGGIWTNPRRWKFYGGADYVRYQRDGGLQDQVLTSVSRNLFFDDPEQQALGALNAEGSPAREGGIGPTAPLFPSRIFPDVPLPPSQYTPNDEGIFDPATVNEFLVPGAERLNAGDINIGKVTSGFRPKLGIEFPNGDRFEVTYLYLQDLNPAQIVDNVAGAAFLMKQISSPNVNPANDGYGIPYDRPIQGGFARFGMHRFGYLDAPFSITQGNRDLQLFLAFRGEDVRAFRPNGLFPHFPYNEQPQPTVFPGPFDPVNNPLLPLFSDTEAFPFFDEVGIRSSDIPREPTSNDFPGQSFLFLDGELAVATFSSDLQGLDFTYKHELFTWNKSWWKLDGLVGMRWVNLNERFSFFFADLYNFSRTTVTGPITPGSGNTATPNIPQPPFFIPNDTPLDPVDQRGQSAEETQITIDQRVANNVFGPQIGLDCRIPMWSYFDVQLMSKGGFMFNAISKGSSVVRGDGLIFTDSERSGCLTSGVIEGQFGFNYHPHPNVRLGIGWEYLWLINIGSAVGAIGDDLGQDRRPNNNFDTLYTGWYVGGEVKF